MPKKNFGKLGRSMAVSSAGVGAVYELRVSPDSLESVMVAGLDYWNPANMPTIMEPQLARNLHIDHFKGMPSVPRNPDETDVWEVDTKRDAYLPAFRFPIWLECKKCHRLGNEPKHFVSKRGQQPTCTDGECGGKGMPVRLVLSCQDSVDSDGGHPGHLDEFPWKWWAHSDPAGKEKPCNGGDLFLDGVKGSITLAGLRVRCDGCGKHRSLRDVFRSRLPQFFGCRGKRPWLDDAEDCGKAVVPLMRGASNVYFPVVASAISIPPFSERLVGLIRNQGAILLDQLGSIETSVLVTMVKNSIIGSQNYPDVEIEEAIWSAAGTDANLVARSDTEQRAAEHKAIIEGRGNPGDDFIAVGVSLDETDLDRFVNFIVKVPALREVRALRGFNRVQRTEQSDPNNAACAPLSKKPSAWLPAIEVRGEGVYIELDSARVLAWQARAAVKKRWCNIRNNVRKACEQDNRVFQEDTFPSAGGILVHTFAHLLINQLTLDCGYSTASLRERLYVGENGTDVFFGFLIYTGTHGADGTLGGLVSQGDPPKMEAAIRAALEKARWCASDPVCMESAGQGPNATNMAACHACCIVSETSCEKGNQFLDRGLLVGVIGEPGIGFFENADRW